MVAALLPDTLLGLVEPFLPTPPLRPKGGRPRTSDRACLTGILFVLRSGILWQMLPQELGCGSRMTCWRRLRDWQLVGVWWVVERTFTWLSQFRRLGVRYDRRADIHEAFLCSVREIRWQSLRKTLTRRTGSRPLKPPLRNGKHCGVFHY
jgi:transposase